MCHCRLQVKAPGLQDVSGLALTLTVPDNTLRSLTVAGSANVYLTAQPAANFGVHSYGDVRSARYRASRALATAPPVTHFLRRQRHSDDRPWRWPVESFWSPLVAGLGQG